MGLGVLDAEVNVVQGTVQLFDDAVPVVAQQTTVHLKHSKDGKIVLAPQPTDDPNDPLNWPRWRRDLNYSLIVMMCFLSLVHGPLLSSVTFVLAEQFDKSVSEIAHLSSYMLLVIGCCAYPYSVLARLYGKRAVFIIAGIVLTVSDIWGARATTFGSLLGARILSGAGQSMFEANGIGIVADIFFLHERGTRVAAFIFAFQSGVTISVPIATRIATRYGLDWAFGGLAITEGVFTLGIIFLFRECAWKREHVDALAHQNENEIIHAGEIGNEDKPVSLNQVEDSGPGTSHYQKEPYIKTLRLFSGRYSKEGPFELAWRSVALTFHPTIFWVAAVSLALSWTAGLAYTVAIPFTSPPYNFSPDAISNLFIAAWLGTLMASLLGGTLDPLIMWMAKKNHNVYEPEFRLVYLVPGLVLFLLGWVGWGWGSQETIPWIGLAIFFCIMYVGSCLLNSACIAYIIDAHRSWGIETQVVVFAIKNFFSYALGYFFVDWYIEAGPKLVYGVSGAVCAAVTLLGIPFYLYGKRLRAYWMKHPFLGIREVH